MKFPIFFLLASLAFGFGYEYGKPSKRSVVTEPFGPPSKTLDGKKPVKRKDAKPAQSVQDINDLPTLIDGGDVIDELMEVLHWKGPPTRYDGPEDKYYLLPTPTDIQALLTFFKFRKEQGYVPDSFDCDDAAREFLYLSKVWGRRYYDGLPASVLTASLYVRIVKRYGDIKPGGLHVINLIGCNDGRYFLLEPQTNDIIPAAEGIQFFEVIRVQL